MLCNLCGKHQATIYFKGIVNNQTIKLHLCESCAKKKGMVFPFGKSIFSLGEMAAHLAASIPTGSTLLGTVCKKCGLTYVEFKQTSQLGCSQCYTTFGPVLEPLLKQIHGSTQHVGKAYRRTVRTGSRMQELARLKCELREAVQKEAYEQAAALRDRIQQLEKEMTMPSTSGGAG